MTTKIDDKTLGETTKSLALNSVMKVLGEYEFHRLATESRLERHGRRSVITARGRTDMLVFVGRGVVQEFVVRELDLDETLIALRGPGDVVSPASLLSEECIPGRAVALTDTTVVKVPRAALMRVFTSQGPSVQGPLGHPLMAWAKLVSATNLAVHRQIVLTKESAEARLARALLDLVEKFGDELEDGTSLIPIRLTRAELASLGGSTVETTIRTLTRWARAMIVTTVEGNLVVNDLKALSGLAAVVGASLEAKVGAA